MISFKELLLFCAVSLVIHVTIIGSTASKPSYNFLGVLHTPSRSHFKIGNSLMLALAKAGHNVTVISPYRLDQPPIGNYHSIQLEHSNQHLKTLDFMVNLNKIDGIWHQMETANNLMEFSKHITNGTLHSQVFKHFLATSKHQHFDAIIIEVFLNEALLGLAHHFRAPIIGYSTVGSTRSTNAMMHATSGGDFSYAHPLLPYAETLTFAQRVVTTAVTIAESFFFNAVYMRFQRQIYKSSFADPKPDLDDLRANVSLVLLNTHYSMATPRPYVPTMVEVGGFHLNERRHRLPDDIQHFLDNGTNGVILFSMGSQIRPSQWSPDHLQAFIMAFDRFPKQRILWKWDETTPPAHILHERFMFVDWLQQEDVLAHANVLLFLTHGGLLSLIEAVWHRVPVVAIPLCCDQPMNVARAVRDGYAVRVAIQNLTDTSLAWSIGQVLQGVHFAKAVQVASDRFRDRAMSPMETAVYWVEYVAKYRGTQHMQVLAKRMSFVERHNLDVIGLFGSIGFLFLIIVLWTKFAIAKRAVDKKKKL